MTKIEQEDNGKRGSFLIYLDNELAGEMTYTWAGEDKFIIDHTAVQMEHEGKGLGNQLVMKAVEFAREKNIKILPLCTFAKSVLTSSDEYKDILF